MTKSRPLGVSVISYCYFAGAAGYTTLLLTWLMSRAALVSFIEDASPSVSLGPALLLEMPGVVTIYFIVMSAFCCAVGIGLWRLQRWAWFVTCAFVVLSFALDFGIVANMFHRARLMLIAVGILRLAFLVAVLAYLNRPSIRRAFGLARAKVAAGQ